MPGHTPTPLCLVSDKEASLDIAKCPLEGRSAELESRPCIILHSGAILFPVQGGEDEAAGA